MFFQTDFWVDKKLSFHRGTQRPFEWIQFWVIFEQFLEGHNLSKKMHFEH